jgi:hypothetical protein
MSQHNAMQNNIHNSTYKISHQPVEKQHAYAPESVKKQQQRTFVLACNHSIHRTRNNQAVL